MEANTAPAVGVSVVTDVARGRQITVQTFYPLGTPKAEVDKILDDLLSPIDRQKALAELPELEDELSKAERTYAQFKEDLAMVDVNHAAAQARREVELDELRAVKQAELDRARSDAKAEEARGNGAIETATNLAEAEWRSQGKRGAFTLTGYAKSNVERLQSAVKQTTEHNEKALLNIEAKYDADIAAKQREIASADGDKDQHLQQITVSITRYEAEIERLTDEIEKRRKTAAG